jgi:DNA mismatch repair protein MutL
MIRVTGFASRPEVQRTNRNGIYIFVNRRLVRDRLLLHAISEAYRNITPPGVFPVVLLFLEMDCQEVDVNVHPAKIEVRFRHPQFVHDFTRDTLRQALSVARPIPGFPSGRAMAAGANGAGMANTLGNADGAPMARSIYDQDAKGGSGIFPANELGNSGGTFSGPPRAVIPTSFGSLAGAAAGFELTGGPDRPIPQRLQFGPSDGSDFSFGAPQQGAAIAEVSAATAPGTLPRADEITDLKPLGQVSSSFIVAVNGEGLWIIDQHVAHERVLFEQHLRARREGAMGGQRVLVPLIVDLNPRQMAIFEQIGEELRANGFEAELMGERSVAIQAAPAGITSGDAEKLLYEILDGIAKENQAISIDSLQAKIAASTSCHAAIKVNTPLDHTKMEWLLGELAKTEYPMSCPHGRPVVLRYSVREIERAFKRI